MANFKLILFYFEVCLTCEEKEQQYILIEDTVQTLVGDDPLHHGQAGDGERQAGHQDQDE